MAILRTLLLIALASPCAGSHAASVDAVRLVEAARSVLEARSTGLPGEWEFVPAGGLSVSQVEGDEVRVEAQPVEGRWPRGRVGVPVQVWVDGQPAQSRMVWFTVRRWLEVPVYARDAQAGESLASVATHLQRRDMAEFADRAPFADPVDTPGALQLRRSVRAGHPVMRDELRSMPDVSRQQAVALIVRRGALVLSTPALAQADAVVGEQVRVLPEGATQWVLARVNGPNEVVLEN